MCVTSMVMDHFREKWRAKPLVSKEEVEEFRRLMERAREYDKQHQEPDCELDEKRVAIKQLAERLGVAITFLEDGGPK